MTSLYEVKHANWKETILDSNQPTVWPQCKGKLFVHHSVKYIRTFGKYLENDDKNVIQNKSPKEGPLGCWLEWEAPTTYRLVYSKLPGGPEAIHYPKKLSPSYSGEHPHSTDPYILSEDREVGHFFYSSCQQNDPIPNYKNGDIVIFTYGTGKSKFLTCVLVIEHVINYTPADYFNSLNVFPFPAIPEHFIRTTLEPLRIHHQKKHDKIFKLCRSRHFSERNKYGTERFSFFPASSSLNGSVPCEVDIGRLGTDNAWKNIFDQVVSQGFHIGLDLRF